MLKTLLAILILGQLTAEDGFNGRWQLDPELTSRHGFGDGAWNYSGNKDLVEKIKQMKIIINNDVLTSEVDGQTTVVDLGKVIVRTESQIVITSAETKKSCLLTLSGKNSMFMEFGHPFRYVFKRIEK
jgi:hypothetical protein